LEDEHCVCLHFTFASCSGGSRLLVSIRDQTVYR
jgi:hypothetical protein